MKKIFLSALLALFLFIGGLPALAHAADMDMPSGKDFSQYLTGEPLHKEELMLDGRPFYQVSLDEAIAKIPSLDGTGKRTYVDWLEREQTEYNAHLMGAITNGVTWNYRIVVQQLTGSETLYSLDYFGGDPHTQNVHRFETEVRGLTTGDNMADVLEKVGLSSEGAALVANELISHNTNFDLNTGKTFGSSFDNYFGNDQSEAYDVPIVRCTVDGIDLKLAFMDGKLADVCMRLILEEAPSPSVKPEAPNVTAPTVVLSSQKLAVDGKNVNCEKYNINGGNYFKLRDLAQLLNGTGSQFGVGYDTATATVTITTGETYKSNGTELTTGVDNSSTTQPSSQTLLIDGAKRGDLTVYNIGGSNFFQLRELGNVLGFEVGYDAATNTAIVRSTQK